MIRGLDKRKDDPRGLEWRGCHGDGKDMVQKGALKCEVGNERDYLRLYTTIITRTYVYRTTSRRLMVVGINNHESISLIAG